MFGRAEGKGHHDGNTKVKWGRNGSHISIRHTHTCSRTGEYIRFWPANCSSTTALFLIRGLARLLEAGANSDYSCPVKHNTQRSGIWLEVDAASVALPLIPSPSSSLYLVLCLEGADRRNRVRVACCTCCLPAAAGMGMLLVIALLYL
jgi:hypothetical protein